MSVSPLLSSMCAAVRIMCGLDDDNQFFKMIIIPNKATSSGSEHVCIGPKFHALTREIYTGVKIMTRVEGSIAHSLSRLPTASSAPTHFDTQLVATDQGSIRLAKRQEPEQGEGVFESFKRSFWVFFDRISHLLCGKGESAARARADEALIAAPARRVSSSCCYGLAGSENRPYGMLMDRTVKSLGVAASVLDQKTLGQRILGQVRKLFACSTGDGESRTLDKLKFKALFSVCRSTATAQRAISRPLERAHDVDSGLNALYLGGFGRALTAEAVQGLVADKPGAPVVRDLAATLSMTKDVATRYRSLPLKQVLKVIGDGQYFLDKGDALALFLGGIVAFAKAFAEQSERVQTQVPQNQRIEACVQHLMGALTPNQCDKIKLRLNDFLAGEACRVFDFANAQSALFREDWVGQQLFRLGFGGQVIEPLLTYLGLQPRADDAPVDIPSVRELNVDELAALSRVLLPPRIHSIKV